MASDAAPTSSMPVAAVEIRGLALEGWVPGTKLRLHKPNKSHPNYAISCGDDGSLRKSLNTNDAATAAVLMRTCQDGLDADAHFVLDLPKPGKQKRKQWTDEEDIRLLRLINENVSESNPKPGWAIVVDQMEGRSIKRCKERLRKIQQPTWTGRPIAPGFPSVSPEPGYVARHIEADDSGGRAAPTEAPAARGRGAVCPPPVHSQCQVGCKPCC